jgi:predicted GIY-YIG superfamily endonuclease
MPRLGLGIHEFGGGRHGWLGLHHDQQAQWDALRGRNQQSPASHMAAPNGCDSWITKRHGLKRLVFAEPHETIQGAIQREKVIKGWPRAWKIRLIIKENPDWADLYDLILA